MADNWQAVDGAGAAVTIAADEISSAKHQRVKISLGADGAGVDLEQFTQAEDAAHVSGDRGVMLLAVRKDTAAALAGADGDYIPLIVDSSGRLHVATRYTSQDDAAGPGYAAAIGGVYQSTVDEVDANDTGIARMSIRRALIEGPDTWPLTFNSGTPVPSGSDLVNGSNGALVAGDFAIRDTNNHYYIIPMLPWRRAWLAFYVSSAFDQALTITLRSASTYALGGRADHLVITWPAALTGHVDLSAGAVSTGGSAGGATVTDAAHYNVPLLSAPSPYLALRIAASVAPTAGELNLYVARAT